MNVTPTPVPNHEGALNALPHAIISVDAQGRVSDANMAAEAFFDISAPMMRRYFLKDLLPFGSPLLAVIGQVRERGAPVNEYRVDLGSPRLGVERLVDIQVAPLLDRWLGRRCRSCGGSLILWRGGLLRSTQVSDCKKDNGESEHLGD